MGAMRCEGRSANGGPTRPAEVRGRARDGCVRRSTLPTHHVISDGPSATRTFPRRRTALVRHLPTIPTQARQIAKATVPDLSESRWTNHAYALASMQLGPAQPEDAPSSSHLRRGGTSQSRQFEDKRRGNLPRCVAGRPSVGHIECRESAGLWDRCAQAVFRCCHFHGTTRRSRRTPILEVMTAQRGGFCASV